MLSNAQICLQLICYQMTSLELCINTFDINNYNKPKYAILVGYVSNIQMWVSFNYIV